MPSEARRPARGLTAVPARVAAMLALLAAAVAAGPAWAREGAACLVAEGPAAASAPAPAASTAPAWARAQMVLDTDDLRVCADGRLLLSLREQSVRALRAEFPGEWPFLAVGYEVRVLSLLGPYLSVEEHRSAENPATTLRERVRVYDLRSPGREVTLDQLFDDAALKQALLQHDALRQAVGARVLARAGAGTNSRGLAQRLTEATQVDREGKVVLPPGWLGGFWFDSRRGHQHLDVGLALPVRSGMREETLSRSRLRLPVPAGAVGRMLQGLPATPDEGSATAGRPPGGWARWTFAGRP